MTEYAPSGAVAAPVAGGRAASDVYRAPASAFVATPDVEVTVEEPHGDVVRWGPIVAEVVTAVTVLLLLTVPGFALGHSALGETNDSRDWGTAW